MATILVTGGAGYIGAHTAHLLLEQGHDVQVLDDLSKGYAHNVPKGRLHIVNLHDTRELDNLFSSWRFDAVIHFAAFIAVGESMKEPERYFRNNVGGSVALLEMMRRHGVRRLVFSSTAAVYGDPDKTPIPEDAPLRPRNPYGESKRMVERILEWLDETSGVRSVSLRYFNACGAEPRFGIGEEHQPETHLIPLILHAAQTGEPLTVYGDDYPTHDGTCIRDYIHVSDLAAAHVRALEHLMNGGRSEVFNAGAGRGYTVLEVIRSAERAIGAPVPFRFGPRREGDAAVLVADSSKLKKTLGWVPQYETLEAMVGTAWEFERRRKRG